MVFSVKKLFQSKNTQFQNTNTLIINYVANGCVYETFGISKLYLIKLQLLLIRAVPLGKPLTTKCFIHVVMHMGIIR